MTKTDYSKPSLTSDDWSAEKIKYFKYHVAPSIVSVKEGIVTVVSYSGNHVDFSLELFERTTHSAKEQLEDAIRWAEATRDHETWKWDCIRVLLSIDALRLAKAISEAEKKL